MKNKVLARFVELLPARPYAADDFEAGLRILPRSMALEMPHIQLHGVVRAYIPFDLDFDGAAFAWEEAGLPAPTIITVNPENSHAHYLYGLDVPVIFPDRNGNGKARRRPMNFYRLIQAAYRERLSADRAYPGYMTKNPLHSRWEPIVFDRTYGLEELADYVDLRGIRLFDRATPALNIDQIQIIPKGYRNDTIFNLARKVAYGQVNLCSSKDDLFNAVMNYCASINTLCAPPLSHKQMAAIAKGISKWCYVRREKFSGNHTNRGVCGFQPMPPVMEANARKEELEKRRRAGAAYTASVRRAKTEQRIAEAIEQLKVEGKRVTKVAVSEITGISERALRKDHTAFLKS